MEIPFGRNGTTTHEIREEKMKNKTERFETVLYRKYDIRSDFILFRYSDIIIFVLAIKFRPGI